jgi:deoxyribose-phosphate aldolase
MIIEYSLYDISLSDNEFKSNIDQAITYKPKTICVLPSYLKFAKNLLPNDISLSTVIDYPLGLSDTKSRNGLIDTSIKNGAKIINIVAQPYFFCNRKYDRFREDIKTHITMCQISNTELRYILEYRVFTYELLYKVSQILLELGIQTIYPSTGYQLDDINDNILAAALINKKVPINIICNGNIWNISQINTIYKTSLYGIKTNSINGLELLSKKNNGSL